MGDCQIKEDLEHILVVIFLVPKRPTGSKNEVFLLSEHRQFALGVEFESGKYRVDVAEEEISLLGGELVGERNWLRKRNVNVISGRKEIVEEGGIILEESSLYVFSGLGKKRRDDEERKKTRRDHIRMVTQIFPARQARRRTIRSSIFIFGHFGDDDGAEFLLDFIDGSHFVFNFGEQQLLVLNALLDQESSAFGAAFEESDINQHVQFLVAFLVDSDG